MLKLISDDTALATTVAVKSKTPVVLVVFDEFSTASLMDRSGRIDRARWPNFASLAGDSTWFRNATTVHPHTEHAVPAILDGKLPQPDELPILSDHPQNLFTFLGGSYDFEVIEGLTHLCPRKLCAGSPKASYGAPDDKVSALVRDLGVVYGHMVLPERYAAELPPIDRAWGNFGGIEQAGESAAGQTKADTCARNVCQLASRIKPTKEPTLYFVHALLPHTPWLYLPSGRSYGGDVHKIPGLDKGRFRDDSWLTTQAEQRYLLQLGYTDRALGILLRRLRETGIYDRALVIAAADHGLGLRPKTQLRNITRANLPDVAFTPLFVKRPGQQRGRIDDSFARTIDIVPTIADVLGARLPWKVDGRSLAGRPLPKNGTVSMLDSGNRPVAASLATLRAERARILADRLRRFGAGSLGRLYRIGPNAQLLGRKVTSLRTRPSNATNVELSQREVLAAVDPASGFLPTYVSGLITGRHPARLDLAIAVNGTLRAVTRTYTEHGETKFAALVPETAFRKGANEIAVYAVFRTGSGLGLEELRGTQLDYTLAGNGTLEASDGTAVRVTRGVSGEVRGTRSGSYVTFGGWAADLQRPSRRRHDRRPGRRALGVRRSQRERGPQPGAAALRHRERGLQVSPAGVARPDRGQSRGSRLRARGQDRVRAAIRRGLPLGDRLSQRARPASPRASIRVSRRRTSTAWSAAVAARSCAAGFWPVPPSSSQSPGSWSSSRGPSTRPPSPRPSCRARRRRRSTRSCTTTPRRRTSSAPRPSG